MKTWFCRLSVFIALTLVVTVFTSSSVRAEGAVSQGCTFKGTKLQGKVQIVQSFPDFKVQVVESFPDLKVKTVSSFPDECGKWQFVESFPDFKIQYVSSFPDFKIKFVDSFPGL